MLRPDDSDTANILLVEDNPGDILLAKEAFKEGRVKNKIHVVTDGEEALLFLQKKGNYFDAVTPDIILLDLNLPKKNGIEVLCELKLDPLLMRIPVIIFTTSSSPSDIQKTYYNHANCYITKPDGYDALMDVVHMIEDFWLRTAKLPLNS